MAAGVSPASSSVFLLLLALLSPPRGHAQPKAKTGLEGLTQLEAEELAFMRSSLRREMESVGGVSFNMDGSIEGGTQAQENTVRRAYRNIARRYKKNIFSDQGKFEFQMRILNLARDALMQGDSSAWGERHEEEETNETVGPGRELPFGSRASDDVLKQIHAWQEVALEEHVHFDDPEKPYHVGHTHHVYREAFATNWTSFVQKELASLWPAAANLRFQYELGLGGEGARRYAETERRAAKDGVAEVAGLLFACGSRDPPLSGTLPHGEDEEGWVVFELRVAENLRNLLAVGNAISGPNCTELAEPERRLSLLELSLQSLEHLQSDNVGGHEAEVAAEIRATHAAVDAWRAKSALTQRCAGAAAAKRTALERLWDDYQFGAVVSEVYPADQCDFQGVQAFVEFHIGVHGELLERRVEQDKRMLRALRSLVALQRALARPASMSRGQWGEALDDLEDAVWHGVAFPELHEAAGRLMGDIANAGLLPEALEARLEHPPLVGGRVASTLGHGREEGEVRCSRTPRFLGLDVPGYSLKPIQRYEERSIHLWGDEEVEERWDPIKLGLAYIDLTPSCDLPLQVAMCFINSALWMWRALQLLGDNCGGDGWFDDYIFEDIWSAPQEAKRVALQYSLKRTIFELVDYAAMMAESQLLPGARLAVQRGAYLLLRRVSARFGLEEDAEKVLQQLKRMLTAARVNPLWGPPTLLVSDAVFVDILSGRLHQAFMETLDGESDPTTTLPSAVPEYTEYEAALLGGAGETVNVTFARFEVMGALLADSDREWEDIEEALLPPPVPVDVHGFRLVPHARALEAGAAHPDAEFAGVAGVRIHLTTGGVSLLLARPALDGGAARQWPLLSAQDVVDVLGIEDGGPLHLSLDLPSELGAGAARYPHHPFQRASTGPLGASRGTEASMLHAALVLQQLAAGTEVAVRAPFATRRCGGEGGAFCGGATGDAALEEHLRPLAGLKGDGLRNPERLFLECAHVPYSQRMVDGALEVRFGLPALGAHTGTPLKKLDEEEVGGWSVAKLRAALRRLGGEGQGPAALEKTELVERVLRAVEAGALLEDDGEANDPLLRFARRLHHHLPSLAGRWPQLARLRPLCALRAAGLVLRLQLEQLNASVSEELAGLRRPAQRAESEAWLALLGDLHARVLAELGFVGLDADGARCLGDEAPPGWSFARCCSVGDYAAECWPEGEQRGRGARRCCGPAASGEEGRFSPELVASVAAQLGGASPRRPRPEDLIPAVAAWLRDPTGAGPDGGTASASVVALLAADAAEPQGGLEAELRRPVEHLAGQLRALAPAAHAEFVPEEGLREQWLPLPTLAASGGRGAVYATVALAPQLQQAEEGEEAAPRGEEVWTLGDLVARAQEKRRADDDAGLPADPWREEDELDGLMSALRRLDERTDELRAGGGASRERATAEAAEEERPCSMDGWLELRREEVSGNVSAGDVVRVRQRGSEDPTGEELRVLEVLWALGDPGRVARVWKVVAAAAGDSAAARYFDLESRAIAVAIPCNGSLPSSESAAGEAEAAAAGGEQRWPSCIMPGVSWSSSDGVGLFVNLGALGIKEGCFREDCSHSDHFAAATPAECSSTCAKIGACRWWTFWETAASTCWLRGAASTLENLQADVAGALSGPGACQPPGAQEAGAAAARDPTLFELILGPTGVPHRELRDEPNLHAVLERFGHTPVSELEFAPPTVTQLEALRVAAIARRTVARL